MNRLVIAVVTVCFLPGVSQVEAGVILPDRLTLDALLGALAVNEDFESYAVTNGTVDVLGASLDSTSIPNAQGPGLIVNGVSIEALPGNSVAWQGANFFSLPSKTIAHDGPTSQQVLDVNFQSPVTAFGLDLFAYNGFQASNTLTIFALDDITILDIIGPVALPGTATPVFVGYFDGLGIGKVRISVPSNQFGPSLDNLTFGIAAVPEPSSVLLWSIFGFVTVAAVRKGRRGKRRIGASNTTT